MSLSSSQSVNGFPTERGELDGFNEQAAADANGVCCAGCQRIDQVERCRGFGGLGCHLLVGIGDGELLRQSLKRHVESLEMSRNAPPPGDWSHLFASHQPVKAVVTALLPGLGDLRSLYANQPALLSWLFGPPRGTGVIHANLTTDDQVALAELLKPPNGALFRAVLASANAAQLLLYEVPLSMLPKPTQSLLDTVERTELPMLLRTRIHGPVGAGLGDGSHVMGPLNGDARIRIKFTICEYFIFCFLLAATNFPANPMPGSPTAAIRPLAGLPAHLIPTQSQTSPISASAFYLDLLSEYAKFFLPPDPGRPESPIPTLSRSASFFNRTAASLAAPSSFSSSSTEHSVFTVLASHADLALAISEFFADTLAELFLGQNALPPSSGPIPALKDPYVKPPMVVVKGTHCIVKLLMTSEMGAVEVGGGSRGGREPVQVAARKRACMALKWKLYSFLRLAFAYCPEEEYFDEVGF